MSVLSIFGASKKTMRDEANRLGISIDEVGRLVPEYPMFGGAVKLRNGQCVRYRYPRSGSASRECWTLLQRDRKSTGTLPNGYQLEHDRPLSDGFIKELIGIAEEFDEEYFEFEATTDSVCVYWEEWGGAAEVRKLHELMQKLANF